MRSLRVASLNRARWVRALPEPDWKWLTSLEAPQLTLRNLELGYADNHLARLRAGRSESIETNSLHLDVLRDLKRVHSHICSTAYPVLEAAGELQPTRLKEADAAAMRVSELASIRGGRFDR